MYDLHGGRTWRFSPDSLVLQLLCMCVLVTQSCLTLCDPMDCSLPGSSVHGILQARILEWFPIFFSTVNYRGLNSLMGQMVKNLPSLEETQVRALDWEDPLEKEMATHSSILAWRISQTEEPVCGVAKSQTRLSD